MPNANESLARAAVPEIRRDRQDAVPTNERPPSEIPVVGGEDIIDELRHGEIGLLKKLSEQKAEMTGPFLSLPAFKEAAQACAERCLDQLRIDDFLWMKRSGLFDAATFESPDVIGELKRVAYRDPVMAAKDPRYVGLLPQSILESPAFKLALEKSTGEDRAYQDLLYGRERSEPSVEMTGAEKRWRDIGDRAKNSGDEANP